MTDYRDGKIYGWNGGDCPVHLKDEVKVWYRCGGNSVKEGKYAYDYSWEWVKGNYDIIAFQVVKKYQEPKVIYCNINENDGLSVFVDKENAIRYGHKVAGSRIAVKFVGVIEDNV